MRLLWSDLGKLRRRPASWVTALLLVVLVALLVLLVVASTRQTTDPAAKLVGTQFVTFPGAYRQVLSLILSIGGLLAVCYGAAIAGSEWGWGTLKAAIARGESRMLYTVANYLSVAVYVLIGLLLAFLAGILATMLGAVATGVGLGGAGDRDALLALPEQLARAWLAMGMNAALGFAIATIARSQLAGIGAAIGLYFAEGIAAVFASGVIKWFPFAASGAVVQAGSLGGGGGGGGGIERLDPNTAVIVTIAWLVGSLVVAALWTERAEISG